MDDDVNDVKEAVIGGVEHAGCVHTAPAGHGPEQFESDAFWRRPELDFPLGHNSTVPVTFQLVDLDYITGRSDVM